MNRGCKYYVVTTQWLYPTESGCDVMPTTYDTLDEAINECLKLCRDEFENYSAYTDPLPVEILADSYSKPYGACITAKNGLDEWWFVAKATEITYGE